MKRGLQKQYFPNEQGNFAYHDLKGRKKGIKNIEDAYIDRVKSAKEGMRDNINGGPADKYMSA